MYCLFCVILCIVCVQMCTVLHTLGVYPTAVNKYISHIISYEMLKRVVKWKIISDVIVLFYYNQGVLLHFHIDN
jgi:hypothetical protein